MDAQQLLDFRANAEHALVAELHGRTHWRGELSCSALSTAVAIFALAQVSRNDHAALITRGCGWLVAHVNADGGWGDTPASPSNLSTTLLCWAVLRALGGGAHGNTLVTADGWLQTHAGGTAPDVLCEAVLAAYGNDRTFSAPILALCALAGCLGEGADGWLRVPQLPFEAAVFPHRFYRWLRLPVVSYALPALIAIGLLRHCRFASTSPPLAGLRNRLTPHLLERLKGLQPANGGFLEAAPLTAFVTMSLAAAGHASHAVVTRGAAFLVANVRPDGAWPIDTDLATWITTLSVRALGADGRDVEAKLPPDADPLPWLLGQQYRVRHPFTGAAPGGWGWTDLPGGVPDADDTAGALVAIHRLSFAAPESLDAARAGVRWLLRLQNRDGGWPTFCKGWGKLPFDRSCPDITAHVLTAFQHWCDQLDAATQSAIDGAIAFGVQYLAAARGESGEWLPLWFGNQQARDQGNPVYGTARVLSGLSLIIPDRLPAYDYLVEDACRWLLAVRNADGGWGGDAGVPSSVEETAVAVEALAGAGHAGMIGSALEWLYARTKGGTQFPAAPIGLYFARLWYHERLYPIVFTNAALNTVLAGC